MNTIRVVAAVVDTRHLTLYKENGQTIIIPQGDNRLAKIVKEITPVLAGGFGAVATVQLDDTENTYTQYEEQSGGLVKLFRVAKSRLTKLFAKPEPVQVLPMSVGKPYSPVNGSAFIEKTPVSNGSYATLTPMASEQIMTAVEEVMAHAKPVSSTDPVEDEETIVAMVGDQMVTGVERLKPQMARAVALGSSKGMDAFFKRVAAVAAERRHSVEDLLRFMERGDLPVAEDGSIVIYKVLRRSDKGRYVDCHTGNVSQAVGSYVCMAPEMVDPNRRNECSNGLHVARRAYIGGFSGDVCVLAKVAPEDVIAVPDYDANKMRVCGYHILFELSDEAFSKLKANRPFTDSEEAQILLGRALAGDHPAPIERVEITGQNGTGLKITSLKAPEKAPKRMAEPVKAEALVDEEERVAAPLVDPKAVSKAVVAAKAEVETRAQKAQRLYNAYNITVPGSTEEVEAAQAVLDYKKSVKLGWTALGLEPDTGEELQDVLNQKN